MHRIPTIATVALCCILAACGKGEVEAPKPRPRPVAVIELKQIDPVGPLQLTGAVQSWKEADIAFEVAAPVEFVVESGDNLVGRWAKDDKVEIEGDVLARLDTSLFEIRRATAAAGVTVAKENLRLAQVQLAVVLPAQVEAARADMVRADAEHTRVKAAFERNAMSEIDYIRAKADKDGTAARHKEAEAKIESKKAEIESLKAQVGEAEASLAETQYDLDRCTLYAPFSAQVASVHIEAGGYAKASEPVAHLIMMDPIQVDVSVSQETAARIQENDRVTLFLPGVERTFEARVHEKATVADARTRTFRISLMARNAMRTGELRIGNPSLDLPRVEALQPLIFKTLVEGVTIGRRMAEETKQLQRDAEGWFVWVAEGMKHGDALDPRRPVVKVRKVRVKPGNERVNYQGIYVMRSLDDLGELKQDSLLCWGVPKDLQEGAEVLVGKEEWHLLPGQLVRVFLGVDPPKPGLYLPMNAIRGRESGTPSVFVIKEGKAHEVSVRIKDAVGSLIGIEPADEAGAAVLVEGVQVAARHVHFLVNGEAVRITAHEEIVP